MSAPDQRSWLWLPLAAASVLGLVWLILAFNEPYSVQDDVRQHVAWLEVLRDPDLFRGDFIAGYFINSNTPVFKGLYELPALLGVSPLLMAKLYPVVLTLLTAWLAYLFLLTTGVGPLAAGMGALLFVQGIWASDDIASATARAFSWPMLLAVLVCWREKRPWLGAVLGFVLSLTYPTAAVFAGGFIGLTHLADLRGGRKTWADLRALWTGPCLVVAGLFVGALAALALGAGEGVVSAEEARAMAEFQDGGRTAYFLADPVKFWLLAKRSGAVPEPVLRDVLVVVAALMALPRWRSLPETVRRLCLASALAGMILWAAAHVTLFTLYLPGRYSLIGLRMALGLLAGAGLAAWWPRLGGVGRAAGLALLIGLPVLALFVPPRALGLISVPEAPAVVEALRQTPKDTLVAGFAPDLDNIPALAQRRVLTAREYHLPYGQDYVREMRLRLGDTAAAVFAGGPEGLRHLAARYGVTHLLIDRREATPAGARQSWWWPILTQEHRLPDCGEGSCRVWPLEQAQAQCVVVEERGEVLLSVACLLRPRTAGSPLKGGDEPRPAAG